MSEPQTRIFNHVEILDPSTVLNRLAQPDLWRHHGLGLLQAYVEKSLRIHVWHPSLTRGVVVDNGARHDHRFDLLSQVLAGTIVNHELDVGPSRHDPPGEWKAWEVMNASQGKHEPPVLSRDELDIRREWSITIPKGQSYVFPKWRYHWTEPVYDENGVVVTVVERANIDDSRLAHILSKDQPAHAFAEGHLPANDLAHVLKRAMASVRGAER